jgi:hypothetical protein
VALELLQLPLEGLMQVCATGSMVTLDGSGGVDVGVADACASRRCGVPRGVAERS